MSTIIDAVIEVLKRCVYNCVSYVIMLTVTESCVGCFTAIGDVYSMTGTVGVPMTTIEARICN